MPVTTPIYDSIFLADAEDWLALRPDGDIASFTRSHGRKTLPQGLIADLHWRREHLADRPAKTVIRPRVVLLTPEQALPARLRLEYITQGPVSGTLYPSVAMAGVSSDATWDGALGAAERLAKEEGFGIPPDADVRWSLLLTDEEGADLPHGSERMAEGTEITGPSAGAAFLLGLYYLNHSAGSRPPYGGREQRDFERLLPMLILPELPQCDTLQPLDGNSARRKLQLLCHWENAILIFPGSLPAQAPSGSLLAGTVAELIVHAEERLRASLVPDSVPWSRRAQPYIGAAADVNALAALLRLPGIVVVDGGGGMGKTTRVLEAAARGKDRSAFPDGLVWADLYEAGRTGLRPDHTLHRAIIGTLVRDGEQKLSLLNRVDQYPTAVRTLLAGRRVLILIEGAEVVPEAEIPALLDVLVGHSTVVWLTRRNTDHTLGCFSGSRHHRVGPMTLDDSLALMASHAGRTGPIPSPERSAWIDIARMAEQIPLFLKWAGRSLAPDWETTAADLACELHATPLENLADPGARLEANALRFFEKSLARIRPNTDCPRLHDLARRFFATLHVFDPSHGAPRDLWSLAAGLDLGIAADRRAGVTARRALRSMGLIQEDETESQPIARPVHALAGSVCAALWLEQPLNLSSVILSQLHDGAEARMSESRPDDWALDSAWQQGCSALAAHYVRWTFQQGFPEQAGTFWDSFLDSIDGQPVYKLHSAVAEARVAQARLLSGRGPEFLMQLAASLLASGDALVKLYDLSDAECRFRESLDICEALHEANKTNARFQQGIAAAGQRLGDLLCLQQRWEEAESIFVGNAAICRDIWMKQPAESVLERNAALSTARLGLVMAQQQKWRQSLEQFTAFRDGFQALLEKAPENTGYSKSLADAWRKIGDVCQAAQDWQGAREAFGKALAINQSLAQAHPEVPDFQRGLAVSWERIGDACQAAQGWQGAREAFGKALAINQSLAQAHPEVPDFQCGLAVSWERIGDACQAAQDWQGAREAFREALAIWHRLAELHPWVADFRRGLAVAWVKTGDACQAAHELQAALDAFGKALAIWKSLAESPPECRNSGTGPPSHE
jgi:tetratricopeptide (TPR) repeat protein